MVKYAIRSKVHGLWHPSIGPQETIVAGRFWVDHIGDAYANEVPPTHAFDDEEVVRISEDRRGRRRVLGLA
jgi:hypothetical protein